MTTFADFVAQRRAEIRQQMAELRAELVKLKAAEEAFEKGEAKPQAAYTDGTVGGSKKTIKELVIDVLADMPDGADARQIIDMIAKRHSVIIQRPSLSPQLSRLKEDGLLELHGTIWKGAASGLKEKGSDQKAEPSSSKGVADLPVAGPNQAAPVGSSPTTSTSIRRKLLSGTALPTPPNLGGKVA